MSATVLTFDIRPRSGAGPLTFGERREEVESALQSLGINLLSSRGRGSRFDFGIQVEYGRDDRLWFIGFSCDKRVVPLYYGRDVFAMTARELHDEVSRRESGPRRLFSGHGSTIFPDQIVALWEADTQYDCRSYESREVWGQVAIGSQEYLEEIRTLHGDA